MDKIIITQDSFGKFANDICRGSYASMTKVNFKALDKTDIKPLGVYGDRSEIIKFFLDLGAIDTRM